jgi:hypothetical protein
VKGDDSHDWKLPNPSNRFDELQARVCRKDHKKRSVGKILFSLGDGVKFGVAIYNLIRYLSVMMLAHDFIFMWSYFLCDCQTIAHLRLCHLGRYFKEPGD